MQSFYAKDYGTRSRVTMAGVDVDGGVELVSVPVIIIVVFIVPSFVSVVTSSMLGLPGS